MPQFPEEIFTPRTMVNLPGLYRDDADTKNLYAEDYNEATAEIVAVEEYLKASQTYRALLSASGTDIIVSAELQNEIGALVFSRLDIGAYALTLAGAFAGKNVFVLPTPFVNGGDDTITILQCVSHDDDSITLVNYDQDRSARDFNCDSYPFQLIIF